MDIMREYMVFSSYISSFCRYTVWAYRAECVMSVFIIMVSFSIFLLDLKHKYSIWSVSKSRGLETKIKINFNGFYVLINSINSTTQKISSLKLIFQNADFSWSFLTINKVNFSILSCLKSFSVFKWSLTNDLYCCVKPN